mgnify:CR=1 FL=1
MWRWLRSLNGYPRSVFVKHSGASFDGHSVAEQAENFVEAVSGALMIKQEHPEKWREICDNAAAQRFTWEAAARSYMEKLYGFE